MLGPKVRSQTQLLVHISTTVGAWALEEFQANNCTTAEEYAQRYNEHLESLISEIQQLKPTQIAHGEFVNAQHLGLSPANPLPTLEWPVIFGREPRAWWGIDAQGQLSRIYRDYNAYCG